ncbi:MAG: S8 family serine peptidase [Spirulinaceae cyanobacterium]
MFGKSQSAAAARRRSRQTFILEPILTPAAGIIDMDAEDLFDPGDPTPEIADYAFVSEPNFETGTFVVGASGEIEVNFLFDGGFYSGGEIGLFSLEGIDAEPGSDEFIHLAASRALSNSELGHVIISDPTDAAKFSGSLREGDFNAGEYQGLRTVEMREGDRIGIIFAPNHTMEEVQGGKTWNVMFSMAEANPEQQQQFGQLHGASGAASTYVFEDLHLSGHSDRDYNDMIFSLRGAEPENELPGLDALLPEEEWDWREGEIGGDIIDYVTDYLPEGNEPIVTVSDRFLNPNENFELIGRVNEGTEIANLEIWVRDPFADDWRTIGVVDEFDPDGSFSFEHQPPLEPGHYEYKTIANYASGLTATSDTQEMTVLSLGDGVELSDRIKVALDRATQLGSYTPEQLAQTTEWLVSVKAGEDAGAIAESLGLQNLGPSGHLPNTYHWSGFDGQDLEALLAAFDTIAPIEFAYLLATQKIELHNPWQEPLVQNGAQWHLLQGGVKTVWEEEQLDGSGVQVGVVDVGFDVTDPTRNLTTHTDLADNYRADLSRDFDENDDYGSRFVTHTLAFPDGSHPIFDTHEIDDWTEHNRFTLPESFIHGKVEQLKVNFEITDYPADDLTVYLVGPKQYSGQPLSERRHQIFSGIGSGPYSSEPDYFNGWPAHGDWSLDILETNEDSEYLAGLLQNLTLEITTQNNHGTNVAGVVAASGSNDQGGSGVAPGAQWAALRVGASGIDPDKAADALSHRADTPEDIDIYQNSWGLSAFYSTFADAEFAIETNAQTHDSIYVFSAGNNRALGGRVDYNGFANARHTIAVGALARDGQAADYSASGSALLISAYSSDQVPADGSNDITTTDSDNQYTDAFGGTSAAAPFVSGVVALMLEANPSLTWRDVQHILIQSADRTGLNATDWTPDLGNGIQHSYRYGFGLINPLAAVQLAKTWQPLPQEQPIKKQKAVARVIEDYDDNIERPLESTIKIDQDLTIESVEVIFEGEHWYRGDLEMILTSPSGEESVLSVQNGRIPEVNPFYGDPTHKWTFTSLRHFGESAQGDWTLKVVDKYDDWQNEQGFWTRWKLNVYGTDPNNTEPTATPLDQTHTYTEDQPLTLTPIAVADADGDNLSVVLSLSDAAAGTLTGGGVSSNAAGIWEFSGTAAEVTTALANLQFIPAADFNGDLAITTEVSDGKIATPLTGLIDLTGTPVNDAPRLEAGQLVTPAVVDEPLTLTYEELIAATGATEVEGETIALTINAPASGSLSQNGVPVTGAITLQPGDTIDWTPDTAGTNVPAFEVIASDGTAAADPVLVSATVNPAPVELPQVSILPVSSNASEDGVAGSFVVARSGADLSEPLTVQYMLSGEAANGQDFTLPAVLTIPAGEASAVISITPLDDDLYEGVETATITVVADAAYELGNSLAHTVTIADNDPDPALNTAPTLNPTATPFPDAVQGQPYPITYEQLVAATGATDAEGDEIQFEIPSVSNGTLTLNGEPVVPGTVMVPGDELVWTPETPGDDQVGFVVQATDGDAVSDAVEITFDVAPEVVPDISEEFQVNTHTDNDQQNPAITALDNGGFVITWESLDQDGSSSGVYARVYDSQSNSIGGEIDVNAFTSGYQGNPSISALSDGKFVVTWQSDGQDGDRNAVYAQIFDAQGNKIDQEFQVNTFTYSNQDRPSVTTLANGNFVVAWESPQDGDNSGVYGRIFDAQGNALSTEFKINSFTSDNQEDVSISALESGGFVATWESENQDGSEEGIYGKIFSSQGISVSSEIAINSYTSDRQHNPSVTGLNNGNFVVTWESPQDGSQDGVYGRIYDAEGNAVSNEFQVNNYSYRHQEKPAISALDDGGFLITWESWLQDGSSDSVFAQRYDSQGVKVGEEFQVNVSSSGSQRTAAIDTLTNGDVVIAWESYGQDSDRNGIYARRFQFSTITPDPLIVINTSDSGIGSLRYAIEAANANPGADPITFNIPTSDPGYNASTGTFMIQPLSELPEISDTVSLDATSQPGFTDKPIIELDGSLAGNDSYGLNLSASDSTIRGFVINRFNAIDHLATVDKAAIRFAGDNNTIVGNYIGTDVTGELDFGNTGNGILGWGTGNIIGGTTAQDRNLISGNDGLGVYLHGNNQQVLGNYIGTDIDGNEDLGNGFGLRFHNVENGLIQNNLVSGNDYDGLWLDSNGVLTGNKVVGNKVGTDITGTQVLANDRDGIVLRGNLSETIIGGVNPADRNLISGNGGFGIDLDGGTGTEILGNYIGTDITGTPTLGNGSQGIRVYRTSDNVIGSTTPGAGNLIAGNAADGMLIYGDNNKVTGNAIADNQGSGIAIAFGDHNTVSANVIHDNAGLGINLIADGNESQVAPTLSSAQTSGSATTVTGTISETPNTTYTLEFFSNPNNDGEGQQFIGSQQVTTDAAGNANFTANLPGTAVGQFVTATATDDGGNTSEFSGAIEIAASAIQIPTDHWNASFINRTTANVSDRASYDFSNPVATADLGAQATNGKLSLYQTEMNGLDYNIQPDDYAMQAWTRTSFEAGQLYKVTTQSDDGVWFRLRDPATGQWLDESIVEGGDGADWQNRSIYDAPRTIFFKVPATGEYDFYVDYYDDFSGSIVDFTVEEAEVFQDFVNPQTQWQSEVYWWDRKLGNQPPANLFANGGEASNQIGTIDLGNNIRSDGKAGLTFDWSDAAIQNDVRLPDNNYAILATTQATLEAGRNYQLRVRGDDGFQLLARNRANGQEVFITPENQWQQAYGAHQVVEFSVPSDGQYDIEAQFYEERGDAYFDLSWEPVNFTGRVISTINSNLRAGPSAADYPVVGQVSPGQNLTFDKWTTGQFINYINELGTASDQWYRLAGTNRWISAALINGQP